MSISAAAFCVSQISLHHRTTMMAKPTLASSPIPSL